MSNTPETEVANSMELTAKEILEKHYQAFIDKEPLSPGEWNKPTAWENEILAAMKEACELAFEAGRLRGVAEEEYDTCGEIDGSPNKQEFINSLFPESK